MDSTAGEPSDSSKNGKLNLGFKPPSDPENISSRTPEKEKRQVVRTPRELTPRLNNSQNSEKSRRRDVMSQNDESENSQRYKRPAPKIETEIPIELRDDGRFRETVIRAYRRQKIAKATSRPNFQNRPTESVSPRPGFRPRYELVPEISKRDLLENVGVPKQNLSGSSKGKSVLGNSGKETLSASFVEPESSGGVLGNSDFIEEEIVETYESPRNLAPVGEIDENDIILENARQMRNLDAEVDDIIEELVEQATNQARYTYRKSILFKIIDKLIYIILIGLGVAIGVLGLKESQINSFVGGILGFVVSAFVGFREEFKFKDRGRVLRQCYHRFTEYVQELRVLSCSSVSALEALDRVKEIELELNKVDMDAFDSQIINTDGKPHRFNSQKKSLAVVRPQDIPPNDGVPDLNDVVVDS